ncbi:MAG: VWA domain-containing protein [Acidobacteria bacterium]|nr:VWA domain-containing protein [Acidobacteriota bacterium]MBI3423750.1 VWA domain-containing protein [Acidobacteriota bacterium]
MTRWFLLLGLALIAPLSLPAPRAAQQPAPQVKPTPAPKPGASPQTTPQTTEQDNVVRISTQLVQIDAVVTDRKGNHLDDLQEEEFELLVDGKKQPLTYFSLTKLKREAAPAASSKDANAPKNAAPTTMPTRNLEPERVARTIAFVVDDLGLSFESTAYTRDALKKFVSQQMQDGDLVGIIRTGRGLGALQQFTSDKRILYAAIDKLTWNPISRDMIPRFGVNDPGASAGEDEDSRQARQDAQNRFNEFRDTVFSVGTLGAINFVVRGLRELPGRKMVVLVSDGFQLFGRDRDNTQVLDNVRRLVDLANRSSVVIYALDAKGLLPLGMTAADDVSQMSQQQINERYSQQSQALADSQEGLTYVARETGGFAMLNNNDLSFGIKQVLKDNESYYLLGFDPEDSSFDRKFHALKVRVTRSGVQVRSRSGFLGIADSAPRPQPKTRDEQILATLYSPFGARDLSLQMTSFFFNVEQPSTPAATAAAPSPNAAAPKTQPKTANDKDNKMPPGTLSFVRSFFHIDADKLTFTDLPDNKKELKLELVAFAFNEEGVVVDQHGRSFAVTLDAARYQKVLERGFFYVADIPIKKPGAYQFRAILRDPNSSKVGSAGQFLQIPDLKKNRLAMSGLVLTGETLPPAGQPATPPATSQESAVKNVDWEASVALRRFPRNVRLIYGFFAYNATLNAAKQPDLLLQVELFQDGKRVFQGQPRPLEYNDKSQLKRLDCVGQLGLTGFSPGEYMLHVIVTDKLAKQKFAQADQWMDFSVR